MGMKKADYNCVPVKALPNDFPTGSLGKAERMCNRPIYLVALHSNGSSIQHTIGFVSTHFNSCQHPEPEYLFSGSGLTLAGKSDTVSYLKVRLGGCWGM